MAARRKRKSRRGGSSVGPIIGIIALALAIAGAVGGYSMLWYKARAAPTLDADLCPEGGATSATAVLLDVTDPISEITKLDLKREFQRIVADVEQHGLIEVYLLTDVESKPDRTFHGCNPGDSESADPWTSNPKKIQQRWDRAFNQPLKKIEEQMGDGTSSKQSPIMAGIQRIVIDSFTDAKLDGKPKRLIVASDMMEFTPAFSMYKSGADFKAFESSAARNKFRTPLDGVDVKLLFFQRESSAALKNLPEFWATWIGSNHGNFSGIERLTGTM
ncbi:hypothetical protein [Rhizobium leguminosarum]|uniref:hypothetical protein n=1 Tax=Rhizobium leguminosarum TaxID=384 RepID=UPI001C96611D|nr:hypothetical protein [Rhizobium leguminosarum]MBY5400997.1 hypothetical protein [Rhizobium leguminosarum]